ncbi:MAG: hypothetical protein SGJ20_07555 [Planctomycetota bacterium]|nr:hypothetical protein [Planctomycetota bacterium]
MSRVGFELHFTSLQVTRRFIVFRGAVFHSTVPTPRCFRSVWLFEQHYRMIA